jgi:hypothetical protein
LSKSILNDLPGLVDCTICLGHGQVRGMFHVMICDPCDGNGKVDAKTGQRVEKERMIEAQRKNIKQLQMQVAYYKSRRASKEEAGHWKDFKEVAGGKQRLD